jgi:tRNA(fMet)-specific endonuclease VapC
MILLDTSICINIINQRPSKILSRFRKYKFEEIGISSVSAAELSFGIEHSGSVKGKDFLEIFLATLKIYPFDVECIWKYGKLRAFLEKKGQTMGTLDTMIAAHALALDMLLVTNHEDEFSVVPGLKTDNWA